MTKTGFSSQLFSPTHPTTSPYWLMLSRRAAGLSPTFLSGVNGGHRAERAFSSVVVNSHFDLVWGERGDAFVLENVSRGLRGGDGGLHPPLRPQWAESHHVTETRATLKLLGNGLKRSNMIQGGWGDATKPRGFYIHLKNKLYLPSDDQFWASSAPTIHPGGSHPRNWRIRVELELEYSCIFLNLESIYREFAQPNGNRDVEQLAETALKFYLTFKKKVWGSFCMRLKFLIWPWQKSFWHVRVSLVRAFLDGLLGSPVPMLLVARTLNSYSTQGLRSMTVADSCFPPSSSGTERHHRNSGSEKLTTPTHLFLSCFVNILPPETSTAEKHWLTWFYW